MARIYSSTDDIIFEGNTGDTASFVKRPVHLLPDEHRITLSGKQIVFPHFRTTFAYGYIYAVDAVGPPVGNIPMDACISAVALPWQEWGPNGVGDGTFTNDLPQEIIGSVPPGVNYIDVRVVLSRTKAPTNYLTLPVPALLNGQQVWCEGGSALVEAIGPWRRAFWIGLQGTDIVLRRYQSVNTPHPSQYPASWSTAYGWSHHGGAGSDKPNIAHIIQTKQGTHPGSASPDGHPRRFGRPDACSLADTSDFSSIYTGSVIIRPGYIKP